MNFVAANKLSQFDLAKGLKLFNHQYHKIYDGNLDVGKTAFHQTHTLSTVDIDSENHFGFYNSSFSYLNLRKCKNVVILNTNIRRLILNGCTDILFINCIIEDMDYSFVEELKLINSTVVYFKPIRELSSIQNLSGTSLHNLTVLNQAAWLKMFLEKCFDGYLAYKTFGMHYNIPDYWKLEPGFTLEEKVDLDRGKTCSYGINLAPKSWFNDRGDITHLWRCLIKYEDLADVCVPYLTDGKFRVARATLLEKVKYDYKV